jgi:hypothetical protein
VQGLHILWTHRKMNEVGKGWGNCTCARINGKVMPCDHTTSHFTIFNDIVIFLYMSHVRLS